MICDSCKVDRLLSDFINNQKFCYKCIYMEKMKKSSEKRKKKPIFCRTCGKKIINDKNDKKIPRTVFCSCVCAKEGHKKQVNNYWTRKVHHDQSCSK
jgi:hypothetical protein